MQDFIAIVISHTTDVSKKLQTPCAGKVILPTLFFSIIIALLLGRDEEGELEVKDHGHGNAWSSHL